MQNENNLFDNNSSDRILSYSTSRSLSQDDIRHLFELIDWGIILFHPLIKDAYGIHPPEIMFKALSLPFLINIPTERALARELKEKIILRTMCGFIEPPTRGMLWNFRHNPPGVYRSIMLHVLIAIALAGRRLHITLPYIYTTDPQQEKKTVWSRPLEFELSDLVKTNVKIWYNKDDTRSISTSGRSPSEILSEIKYWQKRSTKGVEKNLNFPIKVELKISSGSDPFNFIMGLPAWLDPTYKHTFYGIDTLSEIKSVTGDTNIACNILVIREPTKGFHEVLLAKRLNGTGKGSYTLPGGKKQQDESISDCSHRELREETELELLESKPISIKLTHLSGYRQTWSIGVLATKYKGKPKNKEKDQHSSWKWYPLNALPAPLFPPAQFVFEDYMNQRFRGLTWNDLENIPKEPIRQPNLFKP
jgi:8-oxo-dGTP diphosphatase